MPTKPPGNRAHLRFATLATALAWVQPALAQTDDAAPFYAGGSLGVAHVSNVYRQSAAPNSDTVVSTGLLAGLDQRYGRQHLTLDGSLQNNRYAENSELNYRSHTLRAALNWQTVGRLSGVLSAKSDRAMADFNIGGVDPIFTKNIERNDEYQALARLGTTTRFTFEGGWTHRRREYSAPQYDRFAYRQDTASAGVYATPGGNLRLGLVGRRTQGSNPRYPTGLRFNPDTLQFEVTSEVNDYTRNDLDFTTRWSTGGSSTLNTRISRSTTRNSLSSLRRDFSGTTGSVGWNWQPTGKLQVNLQYARDTGQESMIESADLNRVYTSWQLGSSYAVTGKLTLSAKASSSRGRRSGDAGVVVADAVDDRQTYNLGLRWAISRGFSLGCQYDHVKRDSSVALYAFNASSYGCTGQAVFY